MSFGTNLERLRKEHKISQAKLGEMLGLTQQMISSYEKDSSSPNLDILCTLANFFNVSIDSMVGHVITTPGANSKEARFYRYFENLNTLDKDKCITIVETILQDRSLD